MKTETRFYLLYTDDVSDDFDFIECPDTEFIEACEKQGNVFSLEGFQDAFNKEHVSTAVHQLRVIEVPVSPQIEEVTVNSPVYSLDVSFQDILDIAPENVLGAYSDLTEEQQKEFVKKNFHGAKTGFSFGISDPLSDIMSTIAHDLEF